MIKDQLDAIKLNSKGNDIRVFLNHLNNSYSPEQPIELTNENCKLGQARKTILKFVRIFHPDKQHGKEKHIQILYLEITKILNRFNE